MPEWRLTRLRGEFCVTWDDRAPDNTVIRRRYRLGTENRREAEARAASRYAELTRPTGTTVKVLWEGYQRDKAGKAVLDTMVHTWKALEPVFGHLEGDQIGTEDCRSYTKMRRGANKSDGSIHTELGHLRMILVWAKGMKLIPEAPAIERPAKPEPKDRYLTREEVIRLIASAKVPHIRLAILLMISTGARSGAALDLTWDRVDFERGVIRLRNPFDQTARKTRATVPMTDTLKEALQVAKAGALSLYVVEWAGSKVGSIKKGIAAAAKGAKLQDVTPHVLRHSAAVWLVEDGHSFEEVAQFLGHSDVRITYKVYARYSPTHLRKLANTLDLGK
jgi:integrase